MPQEIEPNRQFDRITDRSQRDMTTLSIAINLPPRPFHRSIVCHRR
jgi:hypothetical protein